MTERTVLTDDDLCGIVYVLVKDAEKYRDDRSEDRLKAMAYFDGDAEQMEKYIPSEQGRSKVQSRDVRSAVKKVLPSVFRTILGNDQLVEYQPVGPGDEEGAEQATDYVNYVVLPECNGRDAIEDVISDALCLRNGIVKWWLDERTDVRVSLHTGLDDLSFAQIAGADDVEVIEHTERGEIVPTDNGDMPASVHDIKIKRRITVRQPKFAAVKPENWLIHPDAIRLEDSPIVGEACRLRRTDLVSMGYDRNIVWKLPAASSGPSEQDVEEDRRRRDVEVRAEAPQRALDEIDYYDLLVRVDQDGDGIAELRRMVFAGGVKPEYMLENTEWDDLNYASIVAERRPHQWEGTSIPDDVMEIQKVKTVLLRETLDNLYWQNALQPIVQEGQIENPDSVLVPEFGKPIRVKQGVDVRAAVGYNMVPLVADKSFSMLSYMDAEMTDRTGISEASSGMAPDALQNMTAKASAMVEAAGIGQTEKMVRTLANGLKPAFAGLLRLVIQHQDKPRTVRLRDKWVTFDPRAWNAEMDVTVNIGLGAGTRERDMMVMNQVIGLQKDILASMGPTVGTQYVTPENLYNSISGMVQAAGLKSVSLYFTKPDPQAIQQAMSQKQPSPEEIKAQAAMQLEDKRTQGRIAVEQVKGQQKLAEYRAKLEADAGKEAAQLDADLTTDLQRIEAEAVARMEEADLKARTDRGKAETDLNKALIAQETEREWMGVQVAIADQKVQAGLIKSVADSAGRSLDRSVMPDGNVQGRGQP